jgi:6-phosphogluconolactonase
MRRPRLSLRPDILGVLDKALAERGQAAIALSGGAGQSCCFQRLASPSFNWDGVHLFWVDERPVPPDDDRSNHKLAAEALINSGCATAGK